MPSLQIRNMPEDLHRRLKTRAAQQGRSLSELALAELEHSLEVPTRAELLERIASRDPVETNGSVTEILHREREAN